MAAIKALEDRFATRAAAVNDKALDLNEKTAEVVTEFNNLLALRSQLMEKYGTPKDADYIPGGIKFPVGRGRGGAGKEGGGSGGGRGDDDETNYKSILAKAILDKHDNITLRETLIYTATAHPAGGWTAKLSAPEVLEKEYFSPMPAQNKKMAEALAAMAAVKAEYPDLFKGLPSMTKPEKRRAPGEDGDRGVGGGGAECPKNRVNSLMQVLMGRSCHKEGDMIYTVEESGEETKIYTARLTIPGYDATQEFVGSPSESSKEAEKNAAAAALEWMEAEAAPKLEEHKAHRANREREKQARKKARLAEAGGDTMAAMAPAMRAVYAAMMAKGKGKGVLVPKGKGKGKGWGAAGWGADPWSWSSWGW